jgi:hypothetical protein
MKGYQLVILLLITGHTVFGQLSDQQCYFSTKGGIIRSRLIVLPLSGNNYVVEYYQYGMGMFWGLPYKDTLVYENNAFKSDKNEITITKKKLKIRTADSKRTFKFSVRQTCDQEVNWTRNWSYRETERYQINNEEKSREFWMETDPLLKTHCHDDFVTRVIELKKELRIGE